MNVQKSLLGGKLNALSRICDLIKIDFEVFGKKICLHIQDATFRIIKSGKLLVVNSDMSVPRKNFNKKKFKWDEPGATLFDDQVAEYKEELINSQVADVLVSEKDLILTLNSGLRIEILHDTLESGREVYRIFESGNLESHYVMETR